MDQSTLVLWLKQKFRYSTLGLILGFLSILVGALLFLSGVTGSSDLMTKMTGFEGSLLNAAPGALLFLIGLAVVVVTRLNNKEPE